jgi:tetratricopeptide (TPR) repeat protein
MAALRAGAMGRWGVLSDWVQVACIAGTAFCPGLLGAQEVQPPPAAVQLTPVQLFSFADAARDNKDYATAEAAYRALVGNTDADIRAEARFRLAMMLAYQCKRPTEAAQLLRQILDEKPKVARVRLELARIDAMLGRVSAAGRELRAAQAAGLPPEVERAVRFYAQALDVRRPVGGSVEVTLAPDSNINRATAAPTLATVLGNFALSNDAKASSGLGAAVRGQGFVRVPTVKGVDLLARVSGSANIYRASEFDDFILAPRLARKSRWARGSSTLQSAVRGGGMARCPIPFHG